MFKFKSFLLPVFIFFILSSNSCSSDSSISYQTVQFEGVIWTSNLSTSFATFGSTTESGESGRVSLPVSDGDLLYMLNADDYELYYRYKIEDGTHLVITFDTVNSNAAYVNGSLAFFELNNKPSSWESFKGLSSSEVNQLSTLYLPDHLTHELLDVIKFHEKSLHGTGVFLKNSGEDGLLTGLLSICRPEWLGLEGMANLPQASKENFLGNLKLLWITKDIPAVPNMINCCMNLEDLLISNWDPSKGELVTLSGLKSLQSLTLAECNISDLSNIEFPQSLKRLHLIECEPLTDIDGIKQVPGLESLSLSGNDQVKSLEEINNLTSLKWISFPETTTQAAFLSILANLESLEIVELNQCLAVTDVTRLKDLENLKTLILNSEEFDLQQIAELDQLELIILNSALFEDSPEKIAQLKAQLPQTEIVPGSGLCLGSGWLLLLLPLVLLARIIFRKRPQLFLHR